MNEKVALVTGGIKGTGKEIVKQLLARGIHVVTNYRKDRATAEQFLKEFEAHTNEVHAFQADLGEVDKVNWLFDFIQERYGYLDYFIANAASTAFKSLLDVKAYHITKTYAISVTAFVIGCQRSAKLMKERRGRIVAISGRNSDIYMPYHGLLGSAKSALETLVKYFSVELAPFEINVNAINTAFLNTTSTHIYHGNQYAAIKKNVEKIIPRRRISSGKEIADIVMFLCSKEADWICGQTIRADGGLSHIQPLTVPET